MIKSVFFGVFFCFFTPIIPDACGKSNFSDALHSKGNSDEVKEDSPDRKEFARLCDSLVFQNQFAKLIELCEPFLADATNRKFVTPYLIGAYYFNGDTKRSKKLLLSYIDSLDYLDLAWIICTDNIALTKYFEVESNREPIVLKVLRKYRKEVTCTNKIAGEQILRFFIGDQQSRKVKYAYVGAPTFIQEIKEQEFFKIDSIQNERIYEFYLKSGKYFSPKEVGEAVSLFQAVFFSHIVDIELRKSFYKRLLENSVNEGDSNPITLANFILRTESFNNPNFFKTLEKREAEIGKEYNIENYSYFPF